MNADYSSLPQKVSPRWEIPQTVANFKANPPNEVLVAHVQQWLSQKQLAQHSSPLVLDIGGGAARNALPLAQLGCRVVCTDLSWPMLVAAQSRVGEASQNSSQSTLLPVFPVLAPMAPLPFADNVFDYVIAHGIWNLARSGNEFRAAVGEAARVAKRGAPLFLFTFSRHTIPESDAPVTGETFVFTQFNGEPQCFLSEDEIIAELAQAGWVRETSAPLTEYNRTPGQRLSAAGPPVLYEGVFVKR